MMVKRFFSKPYRFGVVYGALLAAAFVFVLLDVFVIPRAYGDVVESLPGGGVVSAAAAEDAPKAQAGDGAGTESALALAPETVGDGASSGTASRAALGDASLESASETGGAGNSSEPLPDTGAAGASSEAYPYTGAGGSSSEPYTEAGDGGASSKPASEAGAAGISSGPYAVAGASSKLGSDTGAAAASPKPASAAVVTDTSYDDGNISIKIETTRIYETTVHIADIKITDASYLKTALANNQYGRNIDETTSEIASAHGAIFAINGDYYGFRDEGYVLRNGTLYRFSGNGAALVLDSSGNLSCVAEGEISAGVLGSAWQIWSFGPALVAGGEIAVDTNSEISGRSANSNPRTAIGQAGPLHYVAIVSEGRTSGNEGLSLYQLAEVFAQRGCSIAYNLDGGGSSTMVFNGRVVNSPTTNGRRISEREVSDIVYIGYE